MPYVVPAPNWPEIIRGIPAEAFPEKLIQIQVHGSVAPRGKYRHWDTLRHLTPPEGLSHEEWWAGIKLARQAIARQLPLKDARGAAFTFCMPDAAQEQVHFIDQHASGVIAMPELVTADESARHRFLVNSVIEEAIRSSQLEGAHTSRVVAKEMIRSGRLPENRSEQMILNNYRGMEFIRIEDPRLLTPDFVLTLHRILTDQTLDEPSDAGRLQAPGEARVAVYEGDRVVHSPPPAEQLQERLVEMCRFANSEDDSEGFLHPVIRSILLHFWLAYDHPFVDGNGRTARSLFYWSMRKHDYWMTQYLSISRIIREAPSQYGEAFVLTELDERDTTYFILYHLATIKRAIDEARAYLQRKMREVREIESVIRERDEFNYRQLALLSDAVRNPHGRYTFDSHAMSHNVTHQSARTDLLSLMERGLLRRRRFGRQHVFTPVSDVIEKLRGDPPGD
ncbi:MAG: Fic family protein [Actinomycetota bacterium]